jgi:hypothetical protein
MVRLVVLAMLVSSSSVAYSQECRPPKDSSESKLLAFFAAPIAFSPAGHAERLDPGAIRLSFDATYVPKPSAEINRSSFCQRKGESTNLSSVFPRPRIAIGLPGGLFLEGSYLPPVTVMDATPNLGSVALGWSRPLMSATQPGSMNSWITLRAHATFGKVDGSITCAKDALQQTSATQSCYGDTPSDDSYKPNMVGGEAIYGISPNTRFSAYLGGGYTSLRPRFQVGFTSLNGGLDNTKVAVDLSRFSAFAGGRYDVGGGAAITGELYSVPQDVTTFRIGGSLALRRGSGS